MNIKKRRTKVPIIKILKVVTFSSLNSGERSSVVVNSFCGGSSSTRSFIEIGLFSIIESQYTQIYKWEPSLCTFLNEFLAKQLGQLFNYILLSFLSIFYHFRKSSMICIDKILWRFFYKGFEEEQVPHLVRNSLNNNLIGGWFMRLSMAHPACKKT